MGKLAIVPGRSIMLIRNCADCGGKPNLTYREIEEHIPPYEVTIRCSKCKGYLNAFYPNPSMKPYSTAILIKEWNRRTNNG